MRDVLERVFGEERERLRLHFDDLATTERFHRNMIARDVLVLGLVRGQRNISVKSKAAIARSPCHVRPTIPLARAVRRTAFMMAATKPRPLCRHVGR